MRVISYNVNGIRAAIKKGFVEWLSENPADIICLQETKATKEDVDTSEIEKLGYTSYWFSAQKKGYSGVAIFTKIKPDNVVYGTGIEQSDFEGRVIQADFGPITIVNAYFPSGTDQFIETGWIDRFRQLHPEFTGGYTWWSQRFPTVRLQNKGWRIDYICVTDTLSSALKSASIFPDVKHSDHCPIFVELSLKKPK